MENSISEQNNYNFGLINETSSARMPETRKTIDLPVGKTANNKVIAVSTIEEHPFRSNKVLPIESYTSLPIKIIAASDDGSPKSLLRNDSRQQLETLLPIANNGVKHNNERDHVECCIQQSSSEDGDPSTNDEIGFVIGAINCEKSQTESIRNRQELNSICTESVCSEIIKIEQNHKCDLESGEKKAKLTSVTAYLQFIRKWTKRRKGESSESRPDSFLEKFGNGHCDDGPTVQYFSLCFGT